MIFLELGATVIDYFDPRPLDTPGNQTFLDNCDVFSLNVQGEHVEP
jgi:hypothetical protein